MPAAQVVVERLNRQFNYDAAPRILAIFETDNYLAHTLKRMQQSGHFTDTYDKFFFLKTLEGMTAEFQEDWAKIGQPKTNLF